MYEELKNIENDLETLLIRIHNLHRQALQYDKAYIVNTRQLEIFLSKEEVLRLLSISEQELNTLVSFNFFKKKKLKRGAPERFLLRDVIWLRGQKLWSFDVDTLNELAVRKRNEERRLLKK